VAVHGRDGYTGGLMQRSLALALALLFVTAAAEQTPDARVHAVTASAAFLTAAAFIGTDQDRFVRELVQLTEIPAPPFKEQARATAFKELLRQTGLEEVEIDAEGNVTGVRRGSGGEPGMPLVNAHLDTVFPEGTNVTVRRDGTRLMAPGIGDDTRGLAAMLALIRAMNAGGIRTRRDILFAGNVGEEGEGDLRGIRFLLDRSRYKDRIAQVVAIDGSDPDDITRGAVGSRRYRVTFAGPGGHSYGAFGLVNPAFAMGNAIARLSRVRVPAAPKTTYSVGVVAGGTSVNAIPSDVRMDVDMRSESCEELRRLDATFLRIVGEATDEENMARSTREGRIVADPKLIGERPCGETSSSDALVTTAAAAIRSFDGTPTYTVGSTDANLPMSRHIPAITIGRGGPGGRQHSPDEWTDVDPGRNARSLRLLLAILVSVAQ
jgi:acetylornithine deacetylase/succinyl-diaminopimelate desuccinylase-like protein